MDKAPVVEFRAPLPGFPEHLRFLLVRPGSGEGTEDDLVYSLRSVDDPGLRFLVVPPAPFFPGYAPEVGAQNLELLGTTDPTDLLVLLGGHGRVDRVVGHGQPARPHRDRLGHPPRGPGRARRRPAAACTPAPPPERRAPTQEGNRMLVLTRRVGESVRIGDEVTITILDIRGDIARVGITAPRAIAVHRDEVFRELSAANREAVADDTAATALTRALRSRRD